MLKKILLYCGLAVLGAMITVTTYQMTAIAEPAPTIKRTPLQNFDVPATLKR